MNRRSVLRVCSLGLIVALIACRPQPQTGDGAAQAPSPATQADSRRGEVTVSGDDRIAAELTWRPPSIDLAADDAPRARTDAALALREERLYEDAQSAIPLYLALLRLDADDRVAAAGLERSMQQLLQAGEAALQAAGEDEAALRRARSIAAVARTVAPAKASTLAYLAQVDVAERVWELNMAAEADIAAGRYGAQGGAGALRKLREALRLQPGQARALQNLAAVESGLIRQAEAAADQNDFTDAERWLALAARVRPGVGAVGDAHTRLEATRRMRIAALHDEGMAVLFRYNGVAQARKSLQAAEAIARPNDPVVAQLRQRIDLAAHYGLFRPAQVFTDAMRDGGRGPRIRVVPHGAFRMGAEAGERGAQPYEQPAREVPFARGFGMSLHEVTVGEFRRYVEATATRTRAMRRGYSMAWDERRGNFVRRSGVDWRSDYAGIVVTADNVPVLHVSARDAEGYAAWLSEQTGRPYRLPSEAEFEYALRAGTRTLYPWGSAAPDTRVANLTGQLDRSPTGRNWNNAFAGYGDGYWGPAPVGSFPANAYGLHDLTGNVSEWVADCWHDSYRRAPKDGAAWVNPGCRMRVIRGGSWSSSPAQARAAWRAPVDVDTTNAHIGFRVVRDL